MVSPRLIKSVLPSAFDIFETSDRSTCCIFVPAWLEEVPRPTPKFISLLVPRSSRGTGMTRAASSTPVLLVGACAMGPSCAGAAPGRNNCCTSRWYATSGHDAAGAPGVLLCYPAQSCTVQICMLEMFLMRRPPTRGVF